MYESFHWPSTVSPLVDQTLVDHWRDTWPEAEFRREVLAEWTDDVGAYFTEQELTDGSWGLGDGAACWRWAARDRRWRCDWGYSTDANTLAVVALPEPDDRGLCGFGCRGCRRSSVSRTRIGLMILLG